MCNTVQLCTVAAFQPEHQSKYLCDLMRRMWMWSVRWRSAHQMRPGQATRMLSVVHALRITCGCIYVTGAS